MSQLIGEAKRAKTDIAVVWLDLAKAYPSIPHNLIYFALEHYYIPTEVISLVKKHLGGINMRFTAGDITSNWQRLEKGIMAGCTISVTLFITAMNVMLKEAGKECRGPKSLDGVLHPSCRAFMDDITVMTTTEIGMRWVLRRLDEIATWGRLCFKPKKSRSLVIKKGKVHQASFSMQGDRIPTISDEPIKSLGKWFNATLQDKSTVKDIQVQLKAWLTRIDNTVLPGNLKMWCYQHGIIPRLSWPFSLYDIPLASAFSMERTANGYLRKWMGVPKSFTQVCLYSKTAPVVLPLRSIAEKYKVNKIRHLQQLRFSNDPIAQSTRVQSGSRSNWEASTALAEVESRLRHSDIVGTVAEGRKGLGSYKRVPWSKADSEGKKEMTIAEVRKQEEEERRIRAVGMPKQCAWMNWVGFEQRHVGNLLDVDVSTISFLLRAVTDTLPSNANLRLWGAKDHQEGKCKLCGELGTLRHVLSSCKVALSQGRYTWRHNKVLRAIEQVSKDALEAGSVEHDRSRGIQFIPQGALPKRSTVPKVGSPVTDWEVFSDLDKRLTFPADIAETNLRPDLLVISRTKKILIVVELTVPWEERLQEAHEIKFLKYDPLIVEAKRKGWKASCLPIEVGCRGFATKSLSALLRRVGVFGKKSQGRD